MNGSAAWRRSLLLGASERSPEVQPDLVAGRARPVPARPTGSARRAGGASRRSAGRACGRSRTGQPPATGEKQSSTANARCVLVGTAPPQPSLTPTRPTTDRRPRSSPRVETPRSRADSAEMLLGPARTLRERGWSCAMDGVRMGAGRRRRLRYKHLDALSVITRPRSSPCEHPGGTGAGGRDAVRASGTWRPTCAGAGPAGHRRRRAGHPHPAARRPGRRSAAGRQARAVWRYPLAEGWADAVRVAEAAERTASVVHGRAHPPVNPSHATGWHDRIRAGSARAPAPRRADLLPAPDNLNALGQTPDWTDNLLWHHARTPSTCCAPDGQEVGRRACAGWADDAGLGIPWTCPIQLAHRRRALAPLALSFNNDGPFGSVFRYIGDTGTYLARYDDLDTGTAAVDLVRVCVPGTASRARTASSSRRSWAAGSGVERVRRAGQLPGACRPRRAARRGSPR